MYEHKLANASPTAVSMCVASCMFLLTACGLSPGKISLLDKNLEARPLGCDAFVSGDGGELEVPPDLSLPDSSDSLVVPQSGRVSAVDAAFDSYVLPGRLDMEMRREGDVSWLAVDVDPATLWPSLSDFLEENGFGIAQSDATQGYIVTAWRERKLPLSEDGAEFVFLRTRLHVRVEREPDAVTNVFFAAQNAGRKDGVWQLLTSSTDFEHRALMRFRAYLASGRDPAGPRMPSLSDIKIRLDIENLDGVAVLVIGQHYSQVWRRLGVILGRNNIDVRADDRSRGIYLIEYDDQSLPGGSLSATSVPERRLLQLHLLAKTDGETLITVHPDADSDVPLSYEFSQRVLKRLLMAYSPRALASY